MYVLGLQFWPGQALEAAAMDAETKDLKREDMIRRGNLGLSVYLSFLISKVGKKFR